LATFAKDQIGEVVVCREDGRVTIRFDNGRLLMGRDVVSFERVLDQKEEMSRVVGSAPWTPEEANASECQRRLGLWEDFEVLPRPRSDL